MLETKPKKTTRAQKTPPQKKKKKAISCAPARCMYMHFGKTRGFGNRYIMAILGRKYRNIMAKYRKYGISVAIAYGRYPTR
jgi:hypothetical protein